MKLIIFGVLLYLCSCSCNAQLDLTVTTNTAATSPGIYQNNVALDGTIVTYGIGPGLQPKFHVVVMDSSCDVWNNPSYFPGADYMSAYSAAYYQDSLESLKYLDSLINFYILDNHPFVIYTPISYSGSGISNLYPPLAQTLNNYWGSQSTSSETLITLFGIKGVPNSYEIASLSVGLDTLVFTTQVCMHPSQVVSVDELASFDEFKIYPNPSNNEFTIDINHLDVLSISIFDLTGKIVKQLDVNESLNHYHITGLSQGNYIVNIQGQKGEFINEKITIIK